MFLTVAEYLHKYLKYIENIKSGSPHTLKAYEKDLEQAFGEYKTFRPCSNFRQLLQICYQAQVRWADLKPASRNRKAASLKGFLSYLYETSVTTTDLSYRIQCPKVPTHIPHFISVDEVLACLKTFQDENQQMQNSREEILFLLLYGGGLRVGEACRLRPIDFSPQQRSLRILGKGGKERLIILPVNVALKAQKYLETQELSFIFGDQPLNPRVAYDWIRKRGVLAGLLRPLRPHSLRHSYATHLLSSGASLRVLQELLGHSSLVATEKYTHLTLDQLARTLERHHPLGSK